jgi:hypothetical protein
MIPHAKVVAVVDIRNRGNSQRAGAKNAGLRKNERASLRPGLDNNTNNTRAYSGVT